MKKLQINCHYCRQFYITWDPRFPNGCRVLHFKTREMPSLVVQRNSGQACHFYSPKNPEPDKNKKPSIIVA